MVRNKILDGEILGGVGSSGSRGKIHPQTGKSFGNEKHDTTQRIYLFGLKHCTNGVVEESPFRGTKMSADLLRTELVEVIRGKMSKDKAFLEWAIMEIDSRQTEDERESSETKHQNGRGWNGKDAKYGAYLAGYIRSGRRLTGDFVSKARDMMRKYAGQLLRVAATATIPVPSPLKERSVVKRVSSVAVDDGEAF